MATRIAATIFFVALFFSTPAVWAESCIDGEKFAALFSGQEVKVLSVGPGPGFKTIVRVTIKINGKRILSAEGESAAPESELPAYYDRQGIARLAAELWAKHSIVEKYCALLGKQ